MEAKDAAIVVSLKFDPDAQYAPESVNAGEAARFLATTTLACLLIAVINVVFSTNLESEMIKMIHSKSEIYLYIMRFASQASEE
jgi:hypothetical protein